MSLNINISDILKEAPDKLELLNLLADISARWRLIGICFRVSDNDLESIQQSPISDIEKLSAVINRWKDTQSSLFTWETVINALESPVINNVKKANEICHHLSEAVSLPQDPTLVGQKISRRLYDAIAAVATGGCRDPENAVGDSGRAYGRYQICEVYYRDAIEFNPSLSNGGKTWEYTKGPGSSLYSEQVMQSYMNRYATKAILGHVPTDEDIARIHGGGPSGYKMDSTLWYWNKVKSNLKNT